MNTLEIVDTTEISGRERAVLEIEVSETFIDNGKKKPFTSREYGHDAFTDNDDGTITSDLDSPSIVQAMVKTGLSKGAANFKATGSDEFFDNVKSAIEYEQAKIDKQSVDDTQPVQPSASFTEVTNIEAQHKPRSAGQTDARVQAADEEIQHRRAEQANQVVQAQQDVTGNEVEAVSIRKTDDDAESQRRNALAKKVVDAYVVDGNRYMLRGDRPVEAFRDNGKTIKAKLDDERTVSDAVDLMASRGVESIKVSGTKVFNRNAWISAQKHDMDVVGYKPTAQDLAVFQKQQNTITDTTGERAKDVGQTASQGAQPVQSAVSKQAAPGELSGTLVDHGAAPYQNNPDKKTSYFVKVSGNDGKEKTQWGVDLRNAVAESGVQKGDSVTLRKVGTEGVSVQDEHGVKVAAKKASWVIDAPERAAIIKQEQEQDKATIIKAAGAVAASKANDPTDVDAINAMISNQVDSHQGPLPNVPIYQSERQAPALQQQKEQKQEQTP